MSKYDFEIDLSMNTSTGIILDKIKKGSVVLEFGCAAGRMTRYMKEELDCQVYIVEYDEGAYRQALEYAQDGICGDIVDMQWLEKFRNVRFDAVLFVDVLEHLPKPEYILKKAAELLKETGSIYISVPNITHNDILLKAYEEHFDYTATGLLDDTHIHFWGMENIKELAAGSGLSLRKIEATYCPTGFTEQYKGNQRKENWLLENILRERLGGEVYQYVISLDLSGDETVECDMKVPGVRGHIYLDKGNGFSPEQVVAVESEYSGSGSYMTQYTLEDTDEVAAVRFDPLEFQGCILKHISMMQDGIELPLAYSEAIDLGNGIYLFGNDPMVSATQIRQGTPLKLSAEFTVPGTSFVAQVESAFQYLQGKEKVLNEKSIVLNQHIGRLQAEKATIQKQNEKIQKDYSETIAQLEHVKSILSGYIILLNKKETISILQENELKRQSDYIQELQQGIHYYQSLRIVRLRSFVIRVLRAMKRRVMRLFKKGV